MQPGLLSRFGVFVDEGFLDAELCATIAREIAESEAAPATIAAGETGNLVREQQRRTKYAWVSDETRAATQERFHGLTPRLEEHFGLDLRGAQKAQFLRYEEGDYFGAHADSSADEGAPAYARERRISAVAFVNAPSAKPGPGRYGGGELSFYGLVEAAPQVGLGVEPVPGLLVAFRSETLHDVSPVTHGERYTIATWFH